MNDIENQHHLVLDVFKYGISSLHVWIRYLECILHTACTLDIRKVEDYKFGTSNDGNSARALNYSIGHNCCYKYKHIIDNHISENCPLWVHACRDK